MHGRNQGLKPLNARPPVNNVSPPSLTPSSLNALARDLLEGAFPLIWVEGELSGVSKPSSGHVYFTLKDSRAQVRCALFRQRSLRLSFVPQDGLQVRVRGRLSLYEPRGDYQLIADHLEPAGEGALRRAYEALQAQLQAEGLFAEARKRRPPVPPQRLGILTSPTGAAIRDVLSVLARRFPLVEVEVLPVPVQGKDAPTVIRDMLVRADRSGRYDALLLTRGGGSLEDLFAFNDEALARCIADLRTPLVSAIGHEVDFSISDFVADLRAPTPSAAAELLVPDRDALGTRLQRLRRALNHLQAQTLHTLGQRLDQLELRLAAQAPALRLSRMRDRLMQLAARLPAADVRQRDKQQRTLAALGRRLDQQAPGMKLIRERQRLSGVQRQLKRGIDRQLEGFRMRSHLIARTLTAMSPLATLGRGYAILQDAESGRVLARRAEARPGQRVVARLVDGELRLHCD